MFSWPFSQKKKEEESSLPPQVLRAMRTMEDDLTGAPLESGAKKEVSPPPTKSVTPEMPQKTAFFAVPQASPRPKPVTAKAPENLPLSPFLTSNHNQAPSSFEMLKKEKPPPSSTTPLSLHSASPAPPSFVPALRMHSVEPHKKKTFLWVVGILILLLLSAGLGYYFFFQGKWSGSVSSIPLPHITLGASKETPPASPSPSPAETPPHFSSSQANLLSINTETVTPESLRATLLRTAEEVKEENLSGAVEFLIRDQNYNPLAFSRFAYLARLSLPENFLSQLDEEFSLFVFVDNGRPRLGLAVAIKTSTSFQAELSKGERTLPLALSPLFIDTTTASKANLLFKNGSYKGLSTRYTNIDRPLNLSIDYLKTDAKWTVGTSRYTLRAILDKQATETNTSSPASPSSPPASNPLSPTLP